jgi:hypothetical protein
MHDSGALCCDVSGIELNHWYLIDDEEIDPALTDPTEGMGALSLDENESVRSSCYTLNEPQLLVDTLSWQNERPASSESL